MKVEIVVDPSRAPAQPLSARVAPAPAQARAAKAAPIAAGVPGAVPKAAGAGGRRKGNNKRRGEKKPVTAADLDAEMADYATAGAGAPAAPAA